MIIRHSPYNQWLKNSLRTALTVLSSFMLTGCFTFYNVPASDFQDNSKHGRVEIILNNEDKISVDEGQLLIFDSSNNILLVQKDSSVSKIDFQNIKDIKEEKFDFQKTFFSSLWIGAISLSVLCLLVIALWHPGKMS